MVGQLPLGEVMSKPEQFESTDTRKPVSGQTAPAAGEPGPGAGAPRPPSAGVPPLPTGPMAATGKVAKTRKAKKSARVGAARAGGSGGTGKTVSGGRKPHIGMVVAAVLFCAALVGGGFWSGKATTDPTASAEYVALNQSAQTTTKQRDTYLTQRDGLQEELDQQETDMQDRETAVTTAETALKTKEGDSDKKIAEREAAVKKREDAVTGAEKTKAANTVADGTWTVGVDIEPGTYRANADVGSTCYWGIYTTGSNGDDIINNDIPGGGRPSVTLSAGQDFNSTRCGSWTKQ